MAPETTVHFSWRKGLNHLAALPPQTQVDYQSIATRGRFQWFSEAFPTDALAAKVMSPAQPSQPRATQNS